MTLSITHNTRLSSKSDAWLWERTNETLPSLRFDGLYWGNMLAEAHPKRVCSAFSLHLPESMWNEGEACRLNGFCPGEDAALLLFHLLTVQAGEQPYQCESTQIGSRSPVGAGRSTSSGKTVKRANCRHLTTLGEDRC